jgi:hypothetical protein
MLPALTLVFLFNVVISDYWKFTVGIEA